MRLAILALALALSAGCVATGQRGNPEGAAGTTWIEPGASVLLWDHPQAEAGAPETPASSAYAVGIGLGVVAGPGITARVGLSYGSSHSPGNWAYYSATDEQLGISGSVRIYLVK